MALENVKTIASKRDRLFKISKSMLTQNMFYDIEDLPSKFQDKSFEKWEVSILEKFLKVQALIPKRYQNGENH